MSNRPFYSVTFGDKNSWDEWALMPVKAGRIEFATPEVKRESVEVPGADGELDLSEVLTGYPTYENRRGSIKFRFYDNGTPARPRWHNLKNYLHGRTMRAVVEDDFEYYYEGRFMVGDLEWAKRGNWAETEISYDVKPYKLEFSTSIEDWLWNPFNFETGVIREYGGIAVDGETTVTVIGSRMPVVPKFVVTGGALTLSFGTNLYDLPVGTTVIPQITLMDNEYEMIFSGTGTVSIEFRGGCL